MDLRFTRCRGAVVAGGAGRGYVGVIKPCCQPCARTMAVITAVTARDMSSGLTGVCCPVVTAVATPEGIGYVTEAREGPVIRNKVALIAWRVGQGMVGGFYRGLYHGAPRMTFSALRGGVFEDTSGVAGLALYKDMAPLKGKACLEVIEPELVLCSGIKSYGQGLPCFTPYGPALYGLTLFCLDLFCTAFA